tara:strand:- start:1521 stop:1994 length:474 start_codon:yes stop_codon:yes gene_type:complete
MLETRPLVVDESMIVLGGNMRLKALKSSGVFKVPVHQVKGWSEEQKNEFIVKDNIGYGEWDYDILANEWNIDSLSDWGLYLPQFDKDVDYSVLDDYDLSGDLSDMQNGVKKAIQIPFDSEHYEEAFELVKYWRGQGGYVGMMLMDKLKYEKLKNEKN